MATARIICHNCNTSINIDMDWAWVKCPGCSKQIVLKTPSGQPVIPPPTPQPTSHATPQYVPQASPSLSDDLQRKELIKSTIIEWIVVLLSVCLMCFLSIGIIAIFNGALAENERQSFLGAIVSLLPMGLIFGCPLGAIVSGFYLCRKIVWAIILWNIYNIWTWVFLGVIPIGSVVIIIVMTYFSGLFAFPFYIIKGIVDIFRIIFKKKSL